MEIACKVKCGMRRHLSIDDDEDLCHDGDNADVADRDYRKYVREKYDLDGKQFFLGYDETASSEVYDEQNEHEI